MLAVLVPRYTVFENLYLGDDSQISKTLKGELVRMYSRALTFIAKLKTYHEKGIGSMYGNLLYRKLLILTDIGRLFNSVWTPEQLKELIDEVRSQQTVVDDLGRLVDAERMDSTL